MARENELARRRAAAAGTVAGIGGALGYVAGRAYFHLVVGEHPATIILREARVNFHLALVIALFVALVAGLVTAELARTEARVERVEEATLRLALPLLLTLVVLVFFWP